MGALTIHLDDSSRKRRRSRGPIVAAIFGGVVLGSILGKTAPPPPKIVEVPVVVTQTVAVPVPAPAPVPVPTPVAPPVVTATVAPLPPRTTPARRAPVRPAAPVAAPVATPVAPPRPIRPVLEPANIVFTAPGSKMVRVTNPHDRAIKVDRIFIVGSGGTRGYEVDSSQCNGQTLVARGGSCTIMITASPEAVQTGARLDLRMSHDSGIVSAR